MNLLDRLFSYQSLARRCLIGAISAGLLMLSPGAPQLVWAQVGPDGYREALAVLEQTTDLIRDLKGLIDRKQFDMEALTLDLAFEDPEGIAAWVDDNISFEPYRGLLRGAKGTLWSRAGNALDQSVLLASLVNAAGYDVRIQLGELSVQEAEELLLGTLVERSAPTLFTDQQAVEQFTARAESAIAAMGQPVDDWGDLAAENDPTGEVASIASRLNQALQGEGLLPDADASRDAIISEAREYAWVEYRLGPTDGWTPVHPAWPVHVDTPAVEASTTLTGTVPAELQHRVRVQAFVERRIGEELSAVPVMDPWEAPAANINGQGLSFSFVPMLDEADDDRSELERALFVPVWMDAFPEGALAFDLMGNIVPVDVAATMAAGVFRTVGDRFNLATGALGGFGTNSSGPGEGVMATTAAWVEITLVSPGGREETSRHPVAVRGSHEGADLEFADRLGSRQTVTASTSTLPPSWVLDGLIDRIIVSAPLFEVLISEQYGQSEAIAVDTDLLVNVMNQQSSSILLINAFQVGPVDRAGVVGYRSSPGVLVHEMSRVDEELFDSINIVNSEWRILEATERGLDVRSDIAIEQGVHEAHVETEFIAQLTGEVVHSTVTAFRSMSDEARFLVVSSVDDLSLVDVALPESLTRELRAELEAGFVLVLPELDSADGYGWWRIDPLTGETLGLISSGRGGAVPARLAGALDGSRLSQRATSELTGTLAEYLESQLAVGPRIMAAKVFGSFLFCAFLPVIAILAVSAAGLPIKALVGSLFADLPGLGFVVGSLLGYLLTQVLSAAPRAVQGAAWRTFMARCVLVVALRVAP